MHMPDTKQTVSHLDQEAVEKLLKERYKELSAATGEAEDVDVSHLILMVGLPYSGKTTTALELGHPIVSPDAIRLALHGDRYRSESEPMVWAIAKTMVAALFLAGHETVILDACSTSKKRRAEWEDRRWSCTHMLVQTRRKECLARAVRNYDQNIVPIIHRMADRFEWDGWAP